eukprot:4845230-Amphidinium_carterae.1
MAVPSAAKQLNAAHQPRLLLPLGKCLCGGSQRCTSLYVVLRKDSSSRIWEGLRARSDINYCVGKSTSGVSKC